MYIYNLLIACFVSLCFCQELQNQNVESSGRIRRTPEKAEEYVKDYLKDDKVQTSVPPKNKTPLPLSLKPKERQPLAQKSKHFQTTSSLPKINKNAYSNHPLRPILQIQPKNILNTKDVRKRPALPSENNKDENINVPDKLPQKEKSKPRVKAKKIKNLQKKTTSKPTHLIEDVEDVKGTSKPLSTTPNQKTDSQIEKPETKHSNVLPEDVKVKKYSKLEDFSPNLSTNSVTPKLADNLVDAKLNFHKVEASNNNNQDDPKPTKDSKENHHQLDVLEIHADIENNILKMEEMIAAKRRKIDADSVKDDKEIVHSDYNLINEIPISTKKAMKILPLNTPMIDEVVDSTRTVCDDMNKIPDDVFRNAKPLVNSLENKTVEVIEIKQRDYAEVVEKQPLSNDLNKPHATWQECGTQTQESNYQGVYAPDVSLVPPPYEYPYSNEYNINKFYYNNNPYQRNVGDPFQRTWRSWVNTEVIVRMRNPYDTEIQPLTTAQMPQQNTNFNAVHKDVNPSYTSYPCYVYPSICYGTNNGYYQ